MGRAGEVLIVRSVVLQASWRETQVGYYVSLGLMGSFESWKVWFGMSEPLLVVGPASAKFGPRPATLGLVGHG